MGCVCSKLFSNSALATYLAGLYLWDHVDGQEAGNYARRYRPFPVPYPDHAKYRSSDVSIIVPTIDWDEDLPFNIVTWLASKPYELIFVTLEIYTDRLAHTLEFSYDVRKAVQESGTRVTILTVQQANKRTQLCRGINEATGKIVCLVDDDARWTSNQVLTQLLAPFEDDDVGLVGGPIGSYIPKERQNPNVITPWEVAALRIRQRRGPGMQAFFAADGSTNFTVSGLTMLLRTEIVKDPYFQFLFTHDMFDGVRQNTGDDGFITRYLLFQHLLPHRGKSVLRPKQWRLGMQLTPEAEVLTSILRTNEFARQSKRWYRSGLRLRLTCLLYEPGFQGFRETAPYMARKMMGGMLGPIFTIVRFLLWCNLWIAFPKIALLLLLYVLYRWFNSLRGFIRQFPYCRSKLWAAMIADNLYLIFDFYSWVTLSSESWSNRASIVEI
ncbi:glycosyltransferase family 2 protein [Hypoxylon sp. CI-4A]|nr:glycosyltransferase family 2 protein [Hypoxylon sp. CI-4A]